ncbi:MAG TPA: helix-turn-helix domain-containing protein [Armatimonadota bacterium]|nr:helix-turn-helix domain-containing protein [Armatimonadota bacterium]
MDLTVRAGRREQGLRIQKAAEESGISLEDLAREIGCSRALIYQYVSGGVLAHPGKLQKIGRRTGHSLAFFYEESPGTEPAGVITEHPSDLGSAPPALIGPLPPKEPSDGSMMESSAKGRQPESPDRISPDRPRITQISENEQADAHFPLAVVALPYLEELADAQEAYGDTLGLISTCERIVPFARQQGNRESEARAWLRIGNARIQRGHQDMALPALRVGLALFEEVGNTRLSLSCRQSMGRARLSAGDTEGAMAEFERVSGGPGWVNRWQGTVSTAAVYEHRGEFESALHCCETAVEIIDSERGAPREAVEAARSFVISNQANVYLACGDFSGALRLSEELLLAAERSNQREQFIEALINLGICQFYQGEWPLSEENLLRAIDLSRFSGDQPRWGLARAWWSLLLTQMGDTERAKEESKDALRMGLETSSRRCEIQAQLSLGEAYLKSSAAREALYHFEQAARAALLSSTIAQEIMAVERRGAAHLALDDPRTARQDVERAIRDAQTYGIQHVEAMASLQMAAILDREGNPDEAHKFAAAAAGIAERLGLALIYARAKALESRLLDRSDRIDEAIVAGSNAVRVIGAIRSRVAARREDEALLDEPELSAPFREQAARLRRAKREGEAERLIEETNWPPLTDWFESGGD